jgi:hypothetical protein
MKMEEATKSMVVRLEEYGSTLMLLGLTCLFIYLMLETSIGFGVPLFTLILGGGAYGVSKLVRKMVPEL